MIKIFFPLAIVSTVVLAQPFESFLYKAIEQNPYLSASSLQIQQAHQEGNIVQRYGNPTVEVEASKFQSQNGYRVAFNQPIRLWGVGRDKAQVAESLSNRAQASTKMQKAQFVKELSLLYIDYVQKQKLLELANKERDIASNITNISQERYNQGSLSKALLMQANVAYAHTEAMVMEQENESAASYLALIEFSGIPEELVVDFDHPFDLPKDDKENPDILVKESQNSLELAQIQTQSYAVESLGLFGGYEKEPQQNIYRMGISFPLALFNTKQEEKSLKTLLAQQNAMVVKGDKNRLRIRKKSLANTIQTLKQLILKREENFKNEALLLGTYSDAFAIANINLLELFEIKNRMIQTRKEIIILESERNRSIVEYTYLSGNYNE